ncbi:LysR family transcriptional regulator [Alcaligenaceae bacterium A4P071]|nr:LysR family transcriptional regulator [Alcaligenaceae bacterium A4P071]
MNPALLPSLAWFARIAQHRSFTRAAEEMGVSRAALSQNLKALERQLGVRLLYRTTRDMSLTEAGQQLFDTLRRTLGEIDWAVQNLDEARDVPSGLIRVNSSRLAARVLVEPHLEAFTARYPQIHVELILDDTLANIIADGCDARIRLGRSLAEHVVAAPISPALAMVVVGAPAYLQRHGIPKTPADLHAHNCINYRFAKSGTARPWDFIDPGKKKLHFTQSVTGNFTVNDDQSMTRAAVQGLGLMQGLNIALQAELADGRLVRILRTWAYDHAGFHFYSPSRDQMPSKVRALRDFLIEKRENISLA